MENVGLTFCMQFQEIKRSRLRMWTVGLILAALVVVCYCYAYQIRKWNSTGFLPPGSMGLPFIGETLEFIIPSYSLDIHPFIKKRIKRYGPIFRSSMVGRPMIISADPEFNHYIMTQEGRLVEIWYLDLFSKLLELEGKSRISAVGLVHKYIRSTILNQLGAESIKIKLLPQIEDIVNKSLRLWSTQASVEVNHSASVMSFDFIAKHMLGFSDAEKSSEKIVKKISNFVNGLMSFPLNIPGTAYHRCLKNGDEMMDLIKHLINKRRNKLDENHHQDDLLGQLMEDLDKEEFITNNFIPRFLLAFILVTTESISSAVTLVLNFLTENPSVLQELMAEHERVLKSRNDSEPSLTWDEYKSMSFTHQVINETLRLGNVAPGLLRKALKDIEYKGYSIPAGWTLMIVTSDRHVNPDIYEDPLVFNPWRWKDLDSYTISKNFMPFGGGIRQCAGADYTKAFLATFLHVLVTKYRWTKHGRGRIARSPVLRFVDGIQIKVYEKPHK